MLNTHLYFKSHNCLCFGVFILFSRYLKPAETLKLSSCEILVFSCWTEGFLYSLWTEKILQLLVWWNPPKTPQINSKPPEGWIEKLDRFFPEKLAVLTWISSHQQQISGTEFCSEVRQLRSPKSNVFKQNEKTKRSRDVKSWSVSLTCCLQLAVATLQTSQVTASKESAASATRQEESKIEAGQLQV